MSILSSLHIYPIKATRGVALEEARVEPRGLEHDRRWVLVDEAGTALTQREQTRLALVQARVRASGLDVSAPSMQPLTVTFPGLGAPRMPVQIWKDTVSAAVGGEAANAWFSRYLGLGCRLVYMDETAVRPIDPQYDPGGGIVSFADGYPLLLTSGASLADLNGRLDAPVPMHRFRPNLTVSGFDAFDEDRWRQVRIGTVLFHVVKPCARCVVTTIDPETAVGGKEPLRTLESFRRRNGKVYFGENLIPVEAGVVRVGDAVEVVAWREATE